ncbi:IS200/IS605 family transposase [Thiolapillus sp.]|uniref:IS200/IS605 family transposase n=3 Tax=Thiolapillus sp. TaxID=2017437 RepID=UPI00352C954C
MQNYKHGGHTIWDCKYHLVWVTKYRYPILGGDVGLRCRELLREIARSKEMIIYAGSINRDHVHMLIGIPPNLSVSKAVQFLKGKSSHKLLSEFSSLRKRYWGQHLWARGYWVASSGNVTDEAWKEYIKNQKPDEPDDDFSVLYSAFRRNDRLSAVTRSHRLLAGGRSPTVSPAAFSPRTVPVPAQGPARSC